MLNRAVLELCIGWATLAIMGSAAFAQDQVPVLPPAKAAVRSDGFVSLPSERTAASCSKLFGTQEDVLANRRYREQRLVRLRPSSHDYFNLTHRSRRWQVPKHALIKGLRLLSVASDSQGGYAAIMEVQPALAQSLGCEEGAYRVSEDHFLSSSIRLLAIRPDFLLLEKEGMLLYLSKGKTLRFRMIWQSPWEVVYKPSVSKSTPVRAPAGRRR